MIEVEHYPTVLEPVSSVQGRGRTSMAHPLTSVHFHGITSPLAVQSLTFERQIPVNGLSLIPVMDPGRSMFTPQTFLIEISLTSGMAFGSYLLSGWSLEPPLILIPW